MKRYETINSIVGSKLVNYEIPDEPIGDYCVDDSHFVPISEAVKSITGSAGDLTQEFNFDYKDGKDTGFKVPVDRTHRLDALVDTVTALRQNVKDSSEKALKKAQQKALDKKLNDIVSDTTSDTKSN